MNPGTRATRIRLAPRPISVVAGGLSVGFWIAAGFAGRDAGLLLVYVAGALSALALLTLLRIPRMPAEQGAPEAADSASLIAAAPLSWRDPLTGLPGMASFEDHLKRAVARARRDLHPLAVLAIDVDHAAKAASDEGSTTDGETPRRIAQRIETCLRSGDIVARSQDGSFLVALPELKQREDAFRIAWKLAQAIGEMFEAEGEGGTASGVVGVSLFPDDGLESETLRENAAKAMQRAREKGRGPVTGCSPELGEIATDRMDLERRLKSALDSGELALFYQPQFDLKTRKLTTLEALVRWNHPQRGLLRPEHFLGIAEDCGLILPLDAWALCAACRQIRLMQRGGGVPARVAVNISEVRFFRDDFEETVKQAIAENEIEPDFLVLELSERWVMKDLSRSRRKVERLRRMGVRIAIDNFGAGGASLDLLQSMPIDSLKIDRSFIRNLGVYPRSARLVGSILNLARDLGVPAVAEGVESIPQLKALRSLGCDLAQGYLFGMPLPPSSLSRWVSPENAFCEVFRRAVIPLASNPIWVAQPDVRPLTAGVRPASQLLDNSISLAP
ncbi:MAG: GGDEF domain-containing protein [Bryobacterales bacterium]|nr:GGDEF domain-containing protein [Bryobacterales bacterium]